MRDVLSTEEARFLHAVNLVEVGYYLLRRSEQALRTGIELIAATDIEVVRAMDDDRVATAVRLKAHHAPIALGDVFAVALAAHRGATLLTTDRHELRRSLMRAFA